MTTASDGDVMTHICATALVLLTGASAPGSVGATDSVPDADTVHVAPPTGETETDRASILGALERVRPGGTVQFAPGRYHVGEVIPLETPRVTLLGHPDGTALRGCDPAGYEELQREAVRAIGSGDHAAAGALHRRCGMFALTGGHVTVRDLTFEYSRLGLLLGCCHADEVLRPSPGGYRIEGNTFRNSGNSIRAILAAADPTVIRGNRFINTFHALSATASRLHVLDNEISMPEPGRVPGTGHPGSAIGITALPPDRIVADANVCVQNIIAGNRIDGHPDGILLSARQPGTSCRENVVRENTIQVRRVRFPVPWLYADLIPLTSPEDSTFVGVPLALSASTAGSDSADDQRAPARVENNRVENNRIIGAEGLGIAISHASGNRVANNTLTGIELREPFPGNRVGWLSTEWREANGSGIWVSPGSDDNEIVGNTFEDVAGAEVFLEGDRNRVTLRSAADSVLDLGTGNRVIATERAAAPPPDAPDRPRLEPWPADARQDDTLRYTVIINGHRRGERRMWRERPAAWRYEYRAGPEGFYHFPRTERLTLDDTGLPVRLEIEGEMNLRDTWEETFELEDGQARWTALVRKRLFSGDPADLFRISPFEEIGIVDRADTTVVGPAYYAAVHPAHDVGVVARALLRRPPSRRLPLIPAGEVWLEPLGHRTVAVEDRRRTVRHYAVHGLELRPVYAWLDEDGSTFADEWSVRTGWEAAFPDLRRETERALGEHHARLMEGLVPPARDGPVLIRGARLFDPATGRVRPDMTILIAGDRIAAVGRDGDVDVPTGAEIIDAAGRMVLPGLWDMHAHHGIPTDYLELNAPLHMAGGVTTGRDLGSDTEPILSLRRRIQAGEAVGPRLLLAGFIDGPGGRPRGIQAGDATEARAAVDRFAELGYVQIKIFNEVPAELVPVIVRRAEERGLRVSGHVPAGMSVRDAIEAGFDEFQHIDNLLTNLGELPSLFADLEAWYEAFAERTVESAIVREHIELLVSRDIAVDPTLALLDSFGPAPPPWFSRWLERLPPQVRRRSTAYHRFRNAPLHPLWEDIFTNMLAVVRGAHEAGVPILPGTDMMPGAFLHRELELYVEAGIPAPEVLALATLGAASVMGMADELGSIEPGKLADLILVDGDPTADISDIRRVVTVIKDGRIYDPAAIYRALGIRPCCEQASREVDP